MEMGIPCDYRSIFKDRVLFITGVGRSGTTILGKVIGSMKPVYYLFEPAIMKYLAPVEGTDDILRGTLFEDYFLPQVHGRNTNFNEKDWTYSLNHFTEAEIKVRWNLDRRSNAMDFIKEENPLYCIKNPEFQPLLDRLDEIFPGCFTLNIFRNGFDVIGSALERGWYTDEYMAGAIIDYTVNGMPFYLTEEDQELWPGYGQATRAAMVWRTLTEYGFQNNGQSVLDINYEDFCINPYPIIEEIEARFGVRKTDITERHLDTIENWKPETKDVKVNLNMIAEPERGLFLSLMQDLGYAE